MNHDRITGAAKQTLGKLKKSAGNFIGNAKLVMDGNSDITRGKYQNVIGRLKDAAKWS